MAAGKLRIAGCQFAVGPSVRRNSRAIQAFMHRARHAGADLVHFSECALSGYAGVDLESTDRIEWELLRDETRRIMDLARKLKLWVVLGSTHPLTPPHQPHNSLYLIDPAGKIADRYDKRFCTRRDLRYYTPGARPVTFEVNGVRCGLLICFDLRFPRLYEELARRKVQCLFQSFYNARQDGPSVHSAIMRQTMQAHAAIGHFWVSMTNSSAYYAPYPSCFIEPDGRIAAQLRFHRPGMMIYTLDASREFYDPIAPFRALALRGKLSNGRPIADTRSRRRTIL